MERKIPEDAFSAYFAMGPSRSHKALAKKYGVSKRAITKVAVRERWAERLEKVEREARERADRDAAAALDEMNDLHIRIAKSLQAKGLEALRSLPLVQARDIIRAIDLGVRQERLVRGEPTDRQANVEEVTKREMQRWLIRGDDEDEAGADEQAREQ